MKETDSSGRAVSGVPLTLTSTLGNTVSPQSVTTDAVGAATVSYTPTRPGTDTLTVSGLGTSASATVSISNEDFAFTSPAVNSNLIVNTTNLVSVRYKVGGVGQAGKTVTFSATRGTLGATTAVTDVNGDASVTITSPTAGPVTVSAQLAAPLTARTTLTTSYVATLPSTIVLQANPGAVLPNLSGGTVNQSALTATVRDAAGNPVAGKVVNFTAVTDFSNGTISPGSSTTDSNGRAVVQFIPGALTTAANGVQLRATVQENTGITATANLTVSGEALFISIGVSNLLTVFDAVTYERQFNVYVTDANGAPAANRALTLSMYPTYYAKGFLVYNDKAVPAAVWEFGPSSPTICANEDFNRNGRLDSGEDFNGDGRLFPGIPAIIAPASVVTDATGFAAFTVRYGKNYALWASVDITARALVGGTESSQIATHGLGMLIGDAQSIASPANAVSPFGTATSCANPN